ncbi:MAG: 4Fe-4S dicluster domain-containing protein [Clostridiaceae bacterium]|nr:4Fe-4S dicluster domain-containing protein [Clostridiaceae bacterium]
MLEYAKIDTGFKDKIASRPGGERVKNCYLCGTCTAGCPVSSLRNEYSPRRFMRMILLGMKEEVLSSPEIWQCSQCHVCVAHCPQDVRFADIIRILRQMSVEEGYAPGDMLKKVEDIDVDLRKQRIALVEELTKEMSK